MHILEATPTTKPRRDTRAKDYYNYTQTLLHDSRFPFPPACQSTSIAFPSVPKPSQRNTGQVFRASQRPLGKTHKLVRWFSKIYPIFSISQRDSRPKPLLPAPKIKTIHNKRINRHIFRHLKHKNSPPCAISHCLWYTKENFPSGGIGEKNKHLSISNYHFRETTNWVVIKTTSIGGDIFLFLSMITSSPFMNFTNSRFKNIYIYIWHVHKIPALQDFLSVPNTKKKENASP